MGLKDELTASAVLVDEATDADRWRLRDDNGRQTWHYLGTAAEAESWPQTLADRHHLGLPLVCPSSLCTTVTMPLSMLPVCSR